MEDLEDFQLIEDKKGIDITQYKSYNSNVLVLKRDNLKIKFNYYKLNGSIFVNINGEHLFDFKVLLLIDLVTNKKEGETMNIVIKHCKLGEITIRNCNVDMFQKGLHIINDWVNKNRNILKDLYGYF